MKLCYIAISDLHSNVYEDLIEQWVQCNYSKKNISGAIMDLMRYSKDRSVKMDEFFIVEYDIDNKCITKVYKYKDIEALIALV